MSSDLISDILAIADTRRTFASGQTLFLTGDRVEALFIVVAGRVDLVRGDSQGRAITLQRAGSGDILAEASIYSRLYHCDGQGVDAGEAAVIGKLRFLRLLREDAELSLRFSAHLARTVHDARARSEILFLKTVSNRLDAWLALSSDGLPARGQLHLVAREIAVSPEALYRELARRRAEPG